MIFALKMTLKASIFIAVCWLLTFYFTDKGGVLFYFLICLPILVSIFAISFELYEAAKRSNDHFRELKRLEIELDLQRELWWSLPIETKQKWWEGSKGLIDAYNQKMNAWRAP